MNREIIPVRKKGFDSVLYKLWPLLTPWSRCWHRIHLPMLLLSLGQHTGSLHGLSANVQCRLGLQWWTNKRTWTRYPHRRQSHSQGGMVFTGICLSAYLHDISQTDAPKITILNMQCSVMSPGNQFILGSKRQGHVTEKQCRRESLHSCECCL